MQRQLRLVALIQADSREEVIEGLRGLIGELEGLSNPEWWNDDRALLPNCIGDFGSVAFDYETDYVDRDTDEGFPCLSSWFDAVVQSQEDNP